MLRSLQPLEQKSWSLLENDFSAFSYALLLSDIGASATGIAVGFLILLRNSYKRS